MESLPGKPISYWIESTPSTPYPAQGRDVTVDVAVVGAGIVGVTAAFLLKQAGARVCLLDMGRVAGGVSGHTTAKVTSLHSVIYGRLQKSVGRERARLYGEANQAALAWMAHRVSSRGIACDWTEAPAYTLGTGARAARQVTEEAEIAAGLGLPATLTDEIEVDIPFRAAVRFDGQAHFHPRKYLLALAETIPGEGSAIFENTRALSVREAKQCVVVTDRGAVYAKQVILATHMPFPRRTLLYARTHPEGHCVFAASAGASAPRGMYLSLDSYPRSVRPQPAGEQTFLIIGGGAHKTGHGSTRKRYTRLAAQAADRLRPAAIEYRWWTEDYTSADMIPLVGRLNPFSQRTLTATGFGAWGMTNGTAAALLLTDEVLGKENPWKELYDPARLDLATSFVPMVKQTVDSVGKHTIVDRLIPSRGGVGGVKPGEGKVASIEGRAAAVSRGEGGELRVVGSVCSHFGCKVRWNDAEQTWDCPCHGSRYGSDGSLLHGPAVRDLRRIEFASLRGEHRAPEPAARSATSGDPIAGTEARSPTP